MPFKSRVSDSYNLLIPLYSSPTCLQNQKFWKLILQCRTLGLWSPLWGWGLSLHGVNLCNCSYPPAWRSLTQGCGYELHCVSTLLTCIIMAPSVYLQFGETFSSSFQVLLNDSCSVNCCDFGVSWGEVGSESSYSAFLATPVCIISNNVVESTIILTWKV